MSASKFTTPVANLGDINHRLFRIAAQVRAACALVDSDGPDRAQQTAWLLERTEGDLHDLADQVDRLDLQVADHV